MSKSAISILLALPMIACSASSDLAVGTDAAPGDGAVVDALLADGAVDTSTTSFAFMGCNRLQKADWVVATNPSSANAAQLTQTFADLGTSMPASSRFFMTGDLVLGLDADTTVLAGQLAGWKSFYDADPNAKKTRLVPLPGNHEMLVKLKTSGGKVEISNTGADAVWTSWLASSGFGALAGNGPKMQAQDPDALVDDQSKLSYSFDENGVHYVLLNTDTITSTPDSATGSTAIGWVPLAWLTSDLAAAQTNPKVKAIFVLGHKPLVSPTGDTSVDATIAASLVTKMESLLDATTKVKGYLCAHAHLWDARKLPGNRGVYQVVAGNGGSQLETAWATPSYGFTEVRVYQSGRVGVVSHERPVPNPYNASPAAPAVARSEITIAP